MPIAQWSSRPVERDIPSPTAEQRFPWYCAPVPPRPAGRSGQITPLPPLRRRWGWSCAPARPSRWTTTPAPPSLPRGPLRGGGAPPPPPPFRARFPFIQEAGGGVLRWSELPPVLRWPRATPPNHPTATLRRGTRDWKPPPTVSHPSTASVRAPIREGVGGGPSGGGGILPPPLHRPSVLVRGWGGWSGVPGGSGLPQSSLLRPCVLPPTPLVPHHPAAPLRPTSTPWATSPIASTCPRAGQPHWSNNSGGGGRWSVYCRKTISIALSTFGLSQNRQR